MTRISKPFVVGIAMGAMMLWMVHGQITGQSTLTGWALAGFVAIHVLLIATVLGAGLFAAQLSPRLSAFIAKLHRPSLFHFFVMMTGAALTAMALHLYLHGVF